MTNLKKGDIVSVQGGSDELWIEDYNVRVSTNAKVLETPSIFAKKVLLCLEEIDGDRFVNAFVRKSKINKLEVI